MYVLYVPLAREISIAMLVNWSVSDSQLVQSHAQAVSRILTFGSNAKSLVCLVKAGQVAFEVRKRNPFYIKHFNFWTWYGIEYRVYITNRDA